VHIAIVTTSYPDGSPGAEAAGSFVADFAEQLSAHADVTVVAAASRSATRREGGVNVIQFAVPRLPLSLLKAHNPGDWAAILRTLRSGEKALSDMVNSDRPDHIFALWALPSGYWARKVSRATGTPYSTWALGSDIWSLGRIPVLRGVLRRVLRAAHRCYADGLQLADDVREISGRDCHFLASTRVLPPATSVDKAETAPYKLAFLGRWHRNKGADLLLDALQLLSDEDWSQISAIRFFGGGPLHDDVQRCAARLQGQGRPVETGGYLGKQAAADLISWADYLLLPSRIESIPVIFSDAVQLRTPLIATPVGDLPALHKKYDFGFLAASASAEAMAQALRVALRGNANGFHDGLSAAATDFDIADIARRFAAGLDAQGDQ
jgi:glycosyltransferase involved in cell wall biosynthesis